MNREQRRAISGGNKKIDSSLKYLDSPCSITEAAQIARGVAEDVVSDYSNHVGNLQVAMSLQIELMKDVLFSANIISEEDFRKKYIEAVENFNKMQKEMTTQESMEEESSDCDVDMSTKISSIEVKRV